MDLGYRKSLYPHNGMTKVMSLTFQNVYGEFHDKIRNELFKRLGLQYQAIIDADTTTMTVFGNQESTGIGFNRKYRGKRSYAPILSSEGHTGLSLGMELRAGNIHSSTGAWHFIKQQL